MPRDIQLFDGTTLSFPDDTPDDVIDRVAKQETAARNQERDARARRSLPAGVPANEAAGGGRGSAAGPTAQDMRGAELAQMGPIAGTAARIGDRVREVVAERWQNPEAFASANPVLGTAVNAGQGVARQARAGIQTLADSLGGGGAVKGGFDAPIAPQPTTIQPKRAPFGRADDQFADRQQAIDDAVDRIALGADPARVFESFKGAGITPDEIIARGRQLNTGGSFSTAEVQPPRRTAEENAALASRPQGEMRSLRRQGGTVASGASDIGTAAVGGVVTGFKMIADALPTGGDTRLSRGLEDAGRWVDSLRTAASKADEDQIGDIMDAAKDKGVGQQILAAARAFGVAPAEMVAQGVGTSVPAILAALLPGVRESVIGSLAASTGVGAVMGAGSVRGSIFDEVKSALMRQGMSRQEAEDRAEAARSYLGKNGDQVAIGAALGALASLGGVEHAAIGSIRKILGKKGAEAAETRILPATILGGVTEAIPEVAQGGQEKLATNLALAREGFAVDPMQGVAGAAALEGAAGMGAGALAGGVGAAVNRHDVPGEMAALQKLYTPTKLLPPTQMRSEAMRVFDEVGAAFGMSPTFAEKVKKAAAALPADKLPAFLEKATRLASDNGHVAKPVTDPEVEALMKALAPIADEGRAMDRLDAARRADEQGIREFGRGGGLPPLVGEAGGQPPGALPVPDFRAPVVPPAAGPEAAAPPVDAGQPAPSETAAGPVATPEPGADQVAQPQPGDILTKAGNPFSSERAAAAAAKKVPGAQVLPVDGGFVVRPPAAVAPPAEQQQPAQAGATSAPAPATPRVDAVEAGAAAPVAGAPEQSTQPPVEAVSAQPSPAENATGPAAASDATQNPAGAAPASPEPTAPASAADTQGVTDEAGQEGQRQGQGRRQEGLLNPQAGADQPAAPAPQNTTGAADVGPDLPARQPAAEPAAGAARGSDQQPGGERPAQPDAVDGQRVGDGPAGPAAGGEAAAAVPAPGQPDRALTPATGRAALGPTVSVQTKSGKTLTGWVRSDLTPEQAQEVDPYTYKVKDHGGGWFIRERHADALAEKFPPKAADAAAPTPTADAQRSEAPAPAPAPAPAAADPGAAPAGGAVEADGVTRRGPSMEDRVRNGAPAGDGVVASTGPQDVEGDRKFYVTMVRGDRVARLAGPFDTKEEADAVLPRARDEANKVDPRSAFDAFGVSAVTSKEHKPGRLNDALGVGKAAEPAAPAAEAPKPRRAAGSTPQQAIDAFNAGDVAAAKAAAAKVRSAAGLAEIGNAVGVTSQAGEKADALRARVMAAMDAKPAAEQSATPAPAPDAPPATAEAPAQKKAAKPKRADILRGYFVPGRVVKTLGGFDEVLSLEVKDDGSFSVRVHEVRQNAEGQWVRLGKPQDARQHATFPDAREVKAGPVAMLDPMPGEAVPYTEPRADGKPFSNAPARGTPPAVEALDPAPAQAAEEAAPAPAAEPEPSAAPAEAAAPTPAASPAPAPKADGAIVAEAGENLRYNRRNFSSGGLSWSDILAMDPALQVRETVKGRVWPRPNYEKLVEEGMPRPVARALKQFYDSLASKPAKTDEATLKAYHDALSSMRERMLTWAADPVVLSLLASDAMNRTGANARALNERTLDLLFGPLEPGATAYSRFLRGTPAYDMAIRLGGNRFVRALQVGQRDTRRWMDDIEAGWPAAQEAWQKRGFQVVEAGGTYRDSFGRRNTLDPAALPAGKPWAVLDDRGRPKSFAEDEDSAVALAREMVARKDKPQQKSAESGKALGDSTRVGPERRAPGEDISAQRLMDTFGFRGVNFGRKGYIGDELRQQYLNATFDALHDFAELLNVPPQALSLGGQLGLAFGAQGRGGKAAAHFVPGVNEINLTRDSGAGTLAHEFGHALDHYFARLAGLERDEQPFLSEHVGKGPTVTRTARDEAGEWRTTTLPRFGENLRDAIRAAFDAVRLAMNTRPLTAEETRERDERAMTQAVDRLDRALKPLLDLQPGPDDAFDALVGKLKAGDVGEGYAKSGRLMLPANVAALRDRASGRGTTKGFDTKDAWQRVADAASHLQFLTDRRKAGGTHEPQTVASDYSRASAREDGNKGGKGYWATEREKFARAFETWVSDDLRARGLDNTFLSSGGDRADDTTELAMPYPRGIERERMGEAFSALVQAIQVREQDGRPVMFSIADDPFSDDGFADDGDAAGQGQIAASVPPSPEAAAVLKALAENDDLFALPRSTATDLAQIVADIAPKFTISKPRSVGLRTEWTLTNPEGKTATITVRKPNPYGESLYAYDLVGGEMRNQVLQRPGKGADRVREDVDDVWIDVSKLGTGDQGAAVYAIAGAFAHNTGRMFIGDPAGLSDVAMRRRTEHMLSLALKYGTTDFLAPHPRQMGGDPALKVPPMEWVYGDTVGNIERLIDQSLRAFDNAFPDGRRVQFDPDGNRLFTPADGRTVTVEDLLKRGVSDRKGAGRLAPAEAGGRTVARAALLRFLVSEAGRGGPRAGRGDRILAELGRIASLPGSPAPRVLYSVGGPAAAQRPDLDSAGRHPVLSLPVDEVQRLADKVAADGLVTVKVAATVDDLPAGVRAQLGRLSAAQRGRVRALYNPRSDRVWIVADGIRSPQEFAEVLAHEAFHRGFARIPGGEAVLENLAARNEALRAAAAEQTRRFGYKGAVAIEEALAVMAEEQMRALTGWQRLVRFAREVLQRIGRAVGIKPNAVTDGEVAAFIRSAREAGMSRDGIVAGGPTRFARVFGANADRLEVGGPPRVLDGFRRFSGATPNPVDAARAAARILGVRNLPEMVADSSLGRDVPAAVDRDTGRLHYNPAFGAPHGEWVQFMVEELMHAADLVGPDSTMSAGSPRLMPGGDLLAEARAAKGAAGAFLDYPLNPRYGFDEERIAAELFARLAVLYHGDQPLMRRELPAAYDLYHSVFQVERLGPDRAVSPAIPGAGGAREAAGLPSDRPAADGAGLQGRDLARDDAGTAAGRSGGGADGAADPGLRSLHRAFADRLGSPERGARVGGLTFDARRAPRLSVGGDRQPSTTTGVQFPGVVQSTADRAGESIRLSVADEAPADQGHPSEPRIEPNNPKLARRIADAFLDLVKTPETFGWWHKTLGTQFHKAQKSPVFRRVFNAARAFEEDMSAFANRAADLAPSLLPRLEAVADLWTYREMRAKDKAAVADAVFTGTLDNVVYSDAELRSKFGLTDKQIVGYRQFRDAVDKSLDTLVAAEVHQLFAAFREGAPDPALISADRAAEYRAEAIAFTAALKDKADADLAALRKRHQAEAKAFTNATPDGLWGMKLRQGNERKRLEERLAVAENLELDVAERFERIDELKANGYAPLMRFGRFTVTARGPDGETKWFGMFESRFAANRAARQARTEFPGATVTTGTASEESWKVLQGVSPETLLIFGKAAGLDKLQEKELYQQFLRFAIPDRSPLKRLIKRKGTPGFSTDPTRALAAFITSNARRASKLLHEGAMLNGVEDARALQLGDVADEAERLREYMHSQGSEGAAVKNLLFITYLGGSVASALVNLTQTATTTIPYLSSKLGTLGPAQAVAEVGRAVTQLATPKAIDPASALGRDLKRATDEGIVAPQEMHDLQRAASRQFTDWLGDVVGPSAKGIGRRGLFIWGSMFSFAEMVNRRIAFVAAHNIASAMPVEKLRSMGFNTPFDFASDAVSQTQFVYTKAGRPNWARGAVGGILLTFKTYMISYLELFSRMPPREKALMLATLILMSGVAGLPGMEDLEDIIDTVGQRMGYATQTKAWRDQVLRDAFKGDYEWMAGFVQYGVTGLPGSVIDIAGRMGMGNIIPATRVLSVDQTGSRGDSAIKEGLFEALGPFGSLMSAYTQAIGGEPLKAAPVAVQNYAKSVEMAETGRYLDTRGRTVLTGMRPEEVAAKAIGFNPGRVAESSRANLNEERFENLYKTVQKSITDDMAEALWLQSIARRKGDNEMLRQQDRAYQDALRRMEKWNQRYPEAAIRPNLAGLRRKIADMEMDRDTRNLKRAPKDLRGAIANRRAEMATAE